MPEDTWSFVDNDEALFGERQAGIDEFVQRKQEALEARVVNKVLSYFNAPNMSNYVKGKNIEAGRPMELSMLGFHDAFPDFPVYLGAQHIYKARDVTLNNLHRQWTRTPIYEAYIDLKEEAADLGHDGLIGLVFEWQFDGLTILHNYTSALDLPGLRVVRTFAAGRDQTEFVEPFMTFLDAVADWQPTPPIS